MLILHRWFFWRASFAARDVMAERLRQVTAEGWTAAHDDAHSDLSLAMVAALYASPRDDLKIVGHTAEQVTFADAWPHSWRREWDKRKHHARRKRLVIAGALILAEIERMDRRDRVLASRAGYLTRARRRLAGWLSIPTLHGVEFDAHGKRVAYYQFDEFRPLIRTKLARPAQMIKVLQTFGRIQK